MGTPDLIDSFGMFNYFTTNPDEKHEGISGGNVLHVELAAAASTPTSTAR